MRTEDLDFYMSLMQKSGVRMRAGILICTGYVDFDYRQSRESRRRRALEKKHNEIEKLEQDMKLGQVRKNNNTLVCHTL